MLRYKRLVFAIITVLPALLQAKVSVVPFFGYHRCICIENGSTEVIIDANCGGRVLKYALKGSENVIYLDPNQAGYTLNRGKLNGHITGGRFDIGPPKIKPNTNTFWLGVWEVKKSDAMSVTIISQTDSATGLQLLRHFELDNENSTLKVSQTIINNGAIPRKLCNWLRIFAVGGGTAVVPLSVPNRLPAGYIVYDDEKAGMLFQPDLSPVVYKKDNRLYITGSTGKYKKYVMDSDAGWLAYKTPANTLFLMKYTHFTGKPYGEMTALSMSVWYNENEMTELEPMGPWEWIEPGKTSEPFVTEWTLKKNVTENLLNNFLSNL